MKNYTTFASELSVANKELADLLYGKFFGEYKDQDGLLCASERAGDAAHFKEIQIPPAILAELAAEAE